MPASFLIERPPAAAGPTHPLNHHHSVVGFPHHEAVNSGGCNMAPRSVSQQSIAGTGSPTASQLAIQDLVNFAANLNIATSSSVDGSNGSAPSPSMPVSCIGSSPVLGRSVLSSSPTSASSSSSGSLVHDEPLQTHIGPSNSNRKSANMTECVPVPSSEHVAEIVGRQGMYFNLTIKTLHYILLCYHVFWIGKIYIRTLFFDFYSKSFIHQKILVKKAE